MTRGLKRLLNQTCTHERYTGDSAYGPTYDAPETIENCRIEPKRQLVRDSQGNEVVSEARGFFMVTFNTVPESRITFDGQTYIVITVNKHYGLRLPSYVEVALR